jgi:hypothetical protein
LLPAVTERIESGKEEAGVSFAVHPSCLREDEKQVGSRETRRVPETGKEIEEFEVPVP